MSTIAIHHNPRCGQRVRGILPRRWHGMDRLPVAVSAALLALGLLGAMGNARAAERGCSTDANGRVVCPQPGAACLSDRLGNIACAPVGGGIEIDSLGVPRCGRGHCVRDIHGDVFCSNAPRGASAVDRYGKAVCAGGCVPAEARLCVAPSPS